MAYLAVNKEGDENVYPNKPKRIPSVLRGNLKYWACEEASGYNFGLALPSGTIKKILGIELKWEDEPIKLL